MSARSWTPLLAAICTSAKDAALPDDTCRLFFLRLLTQVDSYGRIGLAEHVLHAKVWPLHSKPISETSRSIRECVRTGLLSAHEEDGRRWLAVPDWEQKAGRHLRTERRGIPDFPEGTADNLLDYSGSIQNRSGTVPLDREIDREREKEERAPSRPRARSARLSIEDLVRGGPCDTPAFLAAWKAWEAFHGPYKTDAQPKRMIALGPLRAVEALTYSLAQEYDGIFEPKANGHAPAGGPVLRPNASAYVDNGAIRRRAETLAWEEWRRIHPGREPETAVELQSLIEKHMANGTTTSGSAARG